MPATTIAPTRRGYSADKEQLNKRLARIEGQVRGITRMVTEDRYCIDILTQVAAAQAALDGVALGLLDTTSVTASSRDEPTANPLNSATRSWPASPGCCAAAEDDVMGQTVNKFSYSVPAMSCGHCRAAIISELDKLPGVGEVEVDLDGKTVTVSGESLEDREVRAAIEEAGYEAA